MDKNEDKNKNKNKDKNKNERQEEHGELAPSCAPRPNPAEKAVHVGAILLALCRERQLPRALRKAQRHSPEVHFPHALSAPVSLPCGFSGSSGGRHGAKPRGKKNGHNGRPPSGALFLHIGVLHTLEEAPYE